MISDFYVVRSIWEHGSTNPSTTRCSTFLHLISIKAFAIALSLVWKFGICNCFDWHYVCFDSFHWWGKTCYSTCSFPSPSSPLLLFAFSSCYCSKKSHPPLFSTDRNECLLCARVIEDVLQRRCTMQTFKRTSIQREYNALDRKGGGCLRHCRFVNYHCTCKRDEPLVVVGARMHNIKRFCTNSIVYYLTLSLGGNLLIACHNMSATCQ